MPWSKHWDLRSHIKDFRAPSENQKNNKGVEARYTVLDYLILRANPRLRTHVEVETIMDDTGFTSKEAVSGALAWLFEHGAIYNVPPQYRVGREAQLHHRKYVFQLTGVIKLAGQWVRYLMFSNDDALEMIEEWHNVGLELKVDYDFLIAPALSIIKGSQNEPKEGSQNEPSPNGGLSSISSSLSSTDLEVVDDAGKSVVSGPALPDENPNPEAAARARMKGTVIVPEDKTAKNGEVPATSPGEDVLTHPLTMLLKEKSGITMLDGDMLALLTETIKTRDEGGETHSYPGGLIRQWNTTLGFAEFARRRLNAFDAIGKPWTALDALKNLAKFNFVPPEGSSKWPGFLAWRDANPELCTEIADEPRKPMTIEEIIAQQPDEINAWAAAVTADREEMEQWVARQAAAQRELNNG